MHACEISFALVLESSNSMTLPDVTSFEFFLLKKPGLGAPTAVQQETIVGLVEGVLSQAESLVSAHDPAARTSRERSCFDEVKILSAIARSSRHSLFVFGVVFHFFCVWPAMPVIICGACSLIPLPLSGTCCSLGPRVGFSTNCSSSFQLSLPPAVTGPSQTSVVSSQTFSNALTLTSPAHPNIRPDPKTPMLPA